MSLLQPALLLHALKSNRDETLSPEEERIVLWSYWAGEPVPRVYVLRLSPVVMKGRCKFWRGTVPGGRARGADRSLA